MSYMFYDAKAFNQYIGDWVVSSVTNMHYMFFNARAFNQNIGQWNTGSVTDMGYMFADSPFMSFDQDIGGWDVSSVTDMSWMFWNNRDFNQNLCAWRVDIFVNNPRPSTSYMFLGSGCYNTADPTSSAVCNPCAYGQDAVLNPNLPNALELYLEEQRIEEYLLELEALEADNA